MNGAVSLIETAVQAGVEICFANPGTTEMPLVEALDRVKGIRAVLGLFEGVCTGAADGWGRMCGRPAATILHLGPGLANGLANLHNARRAQTPVVNWIGDMATHHLEFDAPLTSDIAALTGTVGWSRGVRSAQEMADSSLEAVQAALGKPGRVASLILPADCLWGEGSPASSKRLEATVGKLSSGAIEEAARLLQSGATLFLGSTALTERGQQAAARITAATGCKVMIETFAPRWERGVHLPAFPALPYFPEPALAALKEVKTLVLAGSRDPVGFFAYPGLPSRFLPEDAELFTLANPDLGVDATEALEALASQLDAPAYVVPQSSPLVFVPTDQPLNPDNMGRAVAAFTPENAIVVNEGTTTGQVWGGLYAAQSSPFTMLGHVGGAIGQGLPIALGAALASPDRRVIAYQADGSGLYTLQALWSMVRESANVTVIICSNRRYRILQVELARTTAEPGPAAQALTDLSNPTIHWVDLAKGFGMPACSVHTDAELAAALAKANAEPGPSLIEAVMS